MFCWTLCQWTAVDFHVDCIKACALCKHISHTYTWKHDCNILTARRGAALLCCVWLNNMKSLKKENCVCDCLTRTMVNTVHVVHTPSSSLLFWDMCMSVRINIFQNKVTCPSQTKSGTSAFPLHCTTVNQLADCLLSSPVMEQALH